MENVNRIRDGQIIRRQIDVLYFVCSVANMGCGQIIRRQTNAQASVLTATDWPPYEFMLQFEIL